MCSIWTFLLKANQLNKLCSDVCVCGFVHIITCLIVCVFAYFFSRFFEKYPDEQKKFAAFADVPHNELSGNAKFISHSLSIMFSLSSMISSLDDDEVNEALMMKQITNHKPRGVTLEKYKVR